MGRNCLEKNSVDLTIRQRQNDRRIQTDERTDPNQYSTLSVKAGDFFNFKSGCVSKVVTNWYFQ